MSKKYIRVSLKQPGQSGMVSIEFSADVMPMLNQWTGQIQRETGEPVELDQVIEAFNTFFHVTLRDASSQGVREVDIDCDDAYRRTKEAVMDMRCQTKTRYRKADQTVVLLVEFYSWIRREMDVPLERLVEAFFVTVRDLKNNKGPDFEILPMDLFERIKARVKAIGRLAEGPRHPALCGLVDSSVDSELAMHALCSVVESIERDTKEGRRKEDPSDSEIRRLVEDALVRAERFAGLVRVVSRVKEETRLPTEQVVAAYRDVRADLRLEALSGEGTPGPEPDLFPLVKSRALELAFPEGGKGA